MSNYNYDGGPVVPQAPHFEGLLIRDYFAGQLAAAIVRLPQFANLGCDSDIAELAYGIATAMVAEKNDRERRGV